MGERVEEMGCEQIDIGEGSRAIEGKDVGPKGSHIDSFFNSCLW